MRGFDRKPPSASNPFGEGMKASRGIILPPVDPTLKFSVPNSSAQQIKFRLSGFEEMPEFDGSSSGTQSRHVFPVIPPAGRSIPKLNVDTITGAPGSLSNYRTIQAKKLGSVEKKSGKRDMLARFDEAIAKPNIRSSQIKANRIKKQLDQELESRVKNHVKPEKDIFRDEMEKMKDQYLGDMASELGFGFHHLKPSPSPSSVSPRVPMKDSGRNIKNLAMDEARAINKKMDYMMKEWSGLPDGATLPPRPGAPSPPTTLRAPAEVRRMPSVTLKKSSGTGRKPTVGKVPKSSEKLADISLGFRKSLNSFSNRDPRELIKTPPNDILDKLEEKHNSAVKLQSTLVKKPPIPEDKQKKSGPMDKSVILNRVSARYHPVQVQKFGSETVTAMQKSAKPPKDRATKSLGPTRVNSQTMGGVIEFRKLLELQSDIKDITKDEENDYQRERKGKMKQIPEKELFDSNHGLVSGTPIYGKLKDSVKTIDQAAKVAQTLGTLMSRVAGQNQSSQSSGTSLSPRNNNNNNPISVDIQRRASHLKHVAQEAQKSLTMHTVSCGSNSPLSSPMRKEGVEAVGVGVGAGPEIHTQTDELELNKNSKNNFGEFEFVPDMSYADQLILKKLRGMRSNWDDEDEGSNSPKKADGRKKKK